MPVSENLLMPKLVNQKCHQEYIRRQNNQQYYYNKNAKDLSFLNVNDNVMILMNNKMWEPGKIVKIDYKRPRGYYVKHNRSGTIYNRN